MWKSTDREANPGNNSDPNADSKSVLSRRSMLQAIGGIGASTALLSGHAKAQSSGETAPTSSTGSPVDAVVSTADELVDAVQNDDRVIWVKSDATLDMSDYSDIHLRNVSIMSGRGINGDGAKLSTDEYPNKLFRVNGRVHLSGLRIEGPNKEHFEWPGYSSGKITTGITVPGDLTVTNCEMFGWTHAAISVGTLDTGGRLHITDSDIHHCQMGGLGYGVSMHEGDSRIERCTFDHTRHAISAGGSGASEKCSYTAVGNVHGFNTVSHMFDMHGNDDWVAGDRLVIRNNTFATADDNAVKIRGVPNTAAWVDFNEFLHGSVPDAPGSATSAVQQIHYGGTEPFANIELSGNAYGTDNWQEFTGAPLDVIRRYVNNIS